MAVLGYAFNAESQILWLDITPEHPKRVEAIWADLVDGGGGWLRLSDEDPDRAADPFRSFNVRGLHHRYHRLTAEAPDLVVDRSRPKLVRLIAPELCRIEDLGQPFGVVDWPGIRAGTVLAARLEHDTALPMQIGWGDYLLAEALRREHTQPLTTGGTAPAGYWIEPTPWEALIAEAVQAGHITLSGEIRRMPVELPEISWTLASTGRNHLS